MSTPPQQTVILAGDYIQLETPLDCDPGNIWAMEPRFDSPVNDKKYNNVWPTPQEVASVDHYIRMLSNTVDSILLRRREHSYQVREINTVINTVHDKTKSSPVLHYMLPRHHHMCPETIFCILSPTSPDA